MVLEAVMFCIDNSEWMRNGDYQGSRLQAQSEAVNYVARAKIEGNQETSVGLLSMATSRVRVHSSLTRDLGRIMNALADDVQCAGRSNLVGALKTAQLALKNRLNKNQRQRIVVFVGSPVDADPEARKALEKVAKQLKKNSVAVDVVNFGSENMENANQEALQALVDAVNSSDNSHLVNVAPGPGMLSDAVVSSAVMGDAAVPAGAGGAGGFGGAGGAGDFGDDPELAMALQMSMQEEAARQAAAGGGDAGAAAGGAAGGANDMDMDDEEALLQQAIAMSMAAEAPAAAAPAAAEAADAEMQDASAAAPAAGGDADIAAALQDPSFIESLLDEVGVEQDANIDDILQGLSEDQSQKKDDDKKKKKDDDAAK